MENLHQTIINLESLAEMYFDDGKFDEHLDLWDKSEVQFESPFGNFYEADSYINWLKEFYDYTQNLGGTRHFVLNPVVIHVDDMVEFKGYLYIINKQNGSFMGTSVMHDRFKFINGEWKFVYGSVSPDQDLSNLGSK